MTIPQAFDVALQHHRAGRLAEAEAVYRRILAAEPRHADALHLLGVIAHQWGRNEVAVDLITQAIALAPGDPNFHFNLGTALLNKGQLDEAVAAYRQAIALRSSYPEAHYNLGVALRDKNQLDEAIIAFRQAIALKPDFPEAHDNLGNALRDKGHLDEGIASYRQAIALRPDFPAAYSNLSVALYKKGQLDEAIASCRHAIALDPRFPEAYNNLGIALRDKGEVNEAIAAYRQAITLKSDFSEVHSNLGIVLRDKGRLDEAIAACRHATTLKPNYAEAHNYLGNALSDQGRFDEAIASYRRAIALDPTYPEAHNNLGNAFLEQGQQDEAIAAYRRAIALNASNPETRDNLVLALHYLPSSDARSIAEEHQRWQRQHAEPLRPLIRAHAHDRDPHRRLRIGYVSPDFREHSVAFFMEALLASHDPALVEIFGYANVARPDAVTARFQRLAARWREIFRRPDAEVAELIRNDQIDILVDLAGHTANNRLPLFTRKPAPVQVSWLGYPDSTGLEAIDYRLTDALADPPGTTEQLHSEQLFRLPHGAWCYRPPAEAPPVNSLPALTTGHITFGCFNALPKINAPQLRLWARLLRAVPGSRLLLKNRSLRDHSPKEHLRALLIECGVTQEQIELAPYTPSLPGHLALYGRVDIALDTFPYHGTTTTCEALWMGVPVVTLAGATHASRVGVSLLTHAGLAEFIAHAEEDYLQIATTWAGDLARLDRLRSALRRRMERSPLMDAPRFARDIEAAYREMWHRWCAKTSS